MKNYKNRSLLIEILTFTTVVAFARIKTRHATVATADTVSHCALSVRTLRPVATIESVGIHIHPSSGTGTGTGLRATVVVGAGVLGTARILAQTRTNRLPI